VEIDWALADWFIIGLRKKFPKFFPNEIDRERIRMACEAAKVKLSHEYEAKIVLDEPAFQCIITRPLFQNLTKPIFAEITALIRKAVLDGGITIDQVLLVGASCRIAEVKTAMENAFPDYQPDFVRLSGQDRARGASLLADNIYDPDLLKDLSPFRLTCFIPYSATFKLSEGKANSLLVKSNSCADVTRPRLVNRRNLADVNRRNLVSERGQLSGPESSSARPGKIQGSPPPEVNHHLSPGRIVEIGGTKTNW